MIQPGGLVYVRNSKLAQGLDQFYSPNSLESSDEKSEIVSQVKHLKVPY